MLIFIAQCLLTAVPGILCIYRDEIVEAICFISEKLGA